jgi:hypothetical protein
MKFDNEWSQTTEHGTAADWYFPKISMDRIVNCYQYKITALLFPNDFCRRIPFVLLRKPSDTFDTWKHGNSVIYDEILNEMRLLRDELYILCDRIS